MESVPTNPRGHSNLAGRRNNPARSGVGAQRPGARSPLDVHESGLYTLRNPARFDFQSFLSASMKYLRVSISLWLVVGCSVLIPWKIDGVAEDTTNPENRNGITPPEQLQLWTVPPTKLPTVVVSAIAELFNDGLPDPRGCEYREIKIHEFGTRTVTIHGWVLPEAQGHPREAIGWNGVIYQPVEVGAPVDLHAEFAVLAAKRDRRFLGNGIGWPMSDWGSLRADSGLPIEVAFLLRLGEVSLAEGTWDAGYAGDEKAKVADPFAGMASLWLGRWFNQAIEAYLRGDYPLALTICRRLSPVVARVKLAAETRGIADPWPDTESSQHLWQLPTLEAESQRRATAAPYTPALELGSSVSRSEKIARLIRDLEIVSVHQRMNPGQADVFDDPVVQALSKEGDDAVEPLLKCLREDDRLTRSRFTKGMWFDGPVIPVYEAAYTALFRMLDVKFPLYEGDPGDPFRKRDPCNLSREERAALAAKIEAARQKSRGLTLEDKAYRTLQDDHAGAKAWVQAVDDIVQPADGTFTSYRLVRPAVGGYSLHAADKPFVPRGEVLRSRTHPPVTELMIRRFGQAVREPYDDSFRAVIDQNTLGKFLLSLAAWDGKSRLAELRTMQQELVAAYGHHPGSFNEATLVTLYGRRLELGDRTALEDYVAYLEGLKPGDLQDDFEGAAAYFRLMWRHPDEPVIRRAAEEMFGGPGSLYVPLLNEEGKRQLGLSSLFKTPLVGMPEFRQELARGLHETAKAGTVTLYDNGMAAETPSGGSHFYRLDPLAPAAGASVGYRVCDAYANLLSRLDGFPECQTYWPVAERDRAVAACREFLRRYGDHFRYHPGERDMPDYYTRTAHIHFAKLERPATAEDVAQGRAIFSLPGETRVCHLPELPLYADRPDHKEDPVPAVSVSEDGTSEDTIQYATEGCVWQAEETLVDGKWERFYGFAGRYQLEKVPAAEIQFPGWGAPVTVNLSGGIESPIERRDGEEINLSFAARHFVPPAAPLPLTVKIRNHSSLDQEVPAALLLPPGVDKALPPGIKLAVSYSGRIPPRINRYTEPEFDYGEWQDLPLRSEVRSPAGQASGPVLIPTQETTVLSVDLRDYFEATRLGSYRIKAFFRVPGQAEGSSNEIIFSVADPAP